MHVCSIFLILTHLRRVTSFLVYRQVFPESNTKLSFPLISLPSRAKFCFKSHWEFTVKLNSFQIYFKYCDLFSRVQATMLRQRKKVLTLFYSKNSYSYFIVLLCLIEKPIIYFIFSESFKPPLSCLYFFLVCFINFNDYIIINNKGSFYFVI